MSDPESKKTFSDTKQRLAVCFKRYGEARSKASYVVSTAHDEFIYAANTRILPPALVTKMKGIPESGMGYHKVKATFKGTLSCVRGIVKNCETFTTEGDMPDNEFMDIHPDN